jgi:hypothetical protein
MSLSPQQYYFNFSYDFCDKNTLWGKRALKWGKGAAFDMEGFAHLAKMLPFSCFGSYVTAMQNITLPTENVENINSLPTDVRWAYQFGDFQNSGRGKLSLPYKFLEILDPYAFQEIQQSEYHSVAHAIRNAADISRACDIFFRAKKDNSIDPLYEWEARGATEPIYEFAKNSLAKGLIFCAPNVMPTGVSHQRYLGELTQVTKSAGIPCLPELMGATFGCVCPAEPPGPCKPFGSKSRVCMAGASEECDAQKGLKAVECAEEPKPMWPTGIDPRGVGFSSNNSDPISDYRHAGYFLRKSYGGYGNFINANDAFFGTRDPDIFVRYAQAQNAFSYARTSNNPIFQSDRYYTTKRNLPANSIIPVKRIKNITQIKTSCGVRNMLHNGYGVVLSTNVGFSDTRDSIGLSYPDRLWYHTLAIIGCDDTRRLHPDALFLLANSWGEWNHGGQPNWGPIPKGSFLITGSHLDCILGTEFSRVAQIHDCNPQFVSRCIGVDNDPNRDFLDVMPYPTLGGLLGEINRIEQIFGRPIQRQTQLWQRVNCNGQVVRFLSQQACENSRMVEFRDIPQCDLNCESMTVCDYKQCGEHQKPWGIAYALSFDDNPPFMRKDMVYEQFSNLGSFTNSSVEDPDAPTEDENYDCDESTSSGGAGVTIREHSIPPIGGNIVFSYDSYYVSDKFTVTGNGVTYVDTGYVGGDQNATGPGQGSVEFCVPKNTSSLTVTVEGPQGTAWTYTLGCPDGSPQCTNVSEPNGCI